MTRCAQSGSTHNKKDHTDQNNSLPTLSALALISDHLNACLLEKPFQKLHTEGSSPAPPNLLRQSRGSHRVPREPSLLIMPSLAGEFIVSHVCPDLFDILGGMTFQTLRSRVFIRSILLHKRRTHPRTLGKSTHQCFRHLILLTVPQDLLQISITYHGSHRNDQSHCWTHLGSLGWAFFFFLQVLLPFF